jgi:Uma2 family endonuclease
MATTTFSAVLMTEHPALVIQPAENENRDDLFEHVCDQFANRKIEQDAKGNVRVMAPTGRESANQDSEVTAQLQRWTTQDARGRSFSSSVCFVLPDGSKLSPDASWVSLDSNFRGNDLIRKKRRHRF